LSAQFITVFNSEEFFGALNLVAGKMRARTNDLLSSPPECALFENAMTHEHHITELLQAWSKGDPQALEQLIPLVDDELKKIAHAYMSRERPGHPLQTTALVNEALIRLLGGERIEWQSRKHFYGLVARRMRQVLIDYANKRLAAKGPGSAEHIDLDTAVITPEMSEELRLLDEALRKLAEVDEFKATIVEYRYFGGYTLKEVAELLDISEAKVEREWRFARSWLKREMT
jgi:RNA polymerase sigma-70 factor, ECF subfamily